MAIRRASKNGRRVFVGVGPTRVQKGNYPSSKHYTAQARQSTGEVINAILEIFDTLEDVTEDVMLDALEPTFRKSQDYCPTMTGALKDSGYLMVAENGGKPRVEIGYCYGGAPSYGVYVHEIPAYYHEPPTRYKWLQAAVMEDIPEIYNRLGQMYGSVWAGME